jgi:protein phosphatase
VYIDEILGGGALQVVGLTDPGRERSRNEDSFLVLTGPHLSLLAVADGMGGHAAGDVASSLAISVLERYWAGLDQSKPIPKAHFAGIVQNLVLEANRLIYSRAAADPSKLGMGTTLTVGLLGGRRLAIGHVGDSRAYLVLDKRLELLTEDHSLLEQMIQAGSVSPAEAEGHPQRHILTRALGTTPEVKVDLVERELPAHAALLLCTDGLTSLVRDDEILAVIHEHEDPKGAAAALIELANARGGSDNITVVYAAASGRQGS